MNLEIKLVRSHEISNFLASIANLRIKVFREFPYLYEGDLEYEKKYLSRYINAPNSLCILVFDQDHLVGMSSCLPFIEEEDDIKKPYLDAGIDIKKSFYFGESILEANYRGMGLGKEFFKLREEHALFVYPNLERCAFCAVQREDNHPLRPSGYRELRQFWHGQGYLLNKSLVLSYKWKDTNKKCEDAKTLVFWEKLYGRS